jgi:cytochrome b subunit of formate dehydrogenase
MATKSSSAVLLALLVLVAAPPALAETTCADCHDPDPRLAAGVHGGLECLDCHAGADAPSHPEDVPAVDCATCHGDVVEEWSSSAHGVTRSGGAPEAPDCAACHGPAHAVVPRTDPASMVHHQRLADTCGSCHAKPEIAEKFGIPVALPLEAYRASVHGRAVAEGGHAATCSDCHGSHAIFGAWDSRSKVFHPTVPGTCGGCHGEIAEVYRESVHGRAVAKGVREAPVCTDCHGEHRILSTEQAGSPIYATNVPKMTCGRCHSDLRLAEKYGLSADKVPAYEDSYHGLASRSGATTVAHCGSCHGVHDIQPSSDPRSHVNPANLPATCGQCHPGAGTRFAIGSVHVIPQQREHAAVYWVRLGYLWLIWLTIGGMVLHNLLDFFRKVRRPPVRPLTACPTEGERMIPGFRVAHGLLMASFAVLVYTGFALKYPEGWWARPLLQWEASFGLRGWLHRGAGVVLLGALAFHLAHLAASRRARACIAGMRPRLVDVREFRHKVLYLLGRREHPPEAEDVGYPEKAEYIALMWGIVVMAATGFVLWFDDLVLRWLPKWVTDVATVVHFYEAILATLAIVVWHLYFVIFDPVVYPMDTAWLTGRAPLGRVLERRGAHAKSEPSGAPPEPERRPAVERAPEA